MGDKRPEEEAVIISNGDDIFVWRPEEKPDTDVFGENPVVERIKSFLQPISPSMNYFDTEIEGYIPEKEDRLWINPQGAAMYVPRGKVGKLNDQIPTRVQSEKEEFNTEITFKYKLTRPGTVNTVICSSKKEKEKASLVENKVTLDLHKDIVKETIDARKQPFKTENF